MERIAHQRSEVDLAAYDFVFDELSRVTEIASNDGASRFTYAVDGQVASAEFDFQGDEAFQYDLAGNRTEGGRTTGENNRLLSDAEFDYEYDNEGNRTRRVNRATGAATDYIWDHRNRLVEVVDRDAGDRIVQQVRLTYDVADQRIGKSVDVDGDGPAAEVIERYVYDRGQILLVFDGSGQRIERVLSGPIVDQILTVEDAQGVVLWALTDHLNTIRDIVDSNGQVVQHIRYDTFGAVVDRTDPDLKFRFGFTGREFDEETGLLYVRARYYDPATGSFISEDPIGFGGQDENLYRYVGNDPVNNIDPEGTLGPFVIVPLIAIGGAYLFLTDPGVPEDVKDNVSDVLRAADPGAAGAASVFTLGISEMVRNSLMPELTEKSSQNTNFTISQVSSIVALLGLGIGNAGAGSSPAFLSANFVNGFFRFQAILAQVLTADQLIKQIIARDYHDPSVAVDLLAALVLRKIVKNRSKVNNSKTNAKPDRKPTNADRQRISKEDLNRANKKLSQSEKRQLGRQKKQGRQTDKQLSERQEQASAKTKARNQRESILKKRQKSFDGDPLNDLDPNAKRPTIDDVNADTPDLTSRNRVPPSSKERLDLMRKAHQGDKQAQRQLREIVNGSQKSGG